MIELRAKLWRQLGAAALLAGGATLAACGGEGGESAKVGEAGEAGEAAATPVPAGGGEAGEAAIGETGGEGGEAGAETVYARLDQNARTALRLQHLKGFLLVAQKELEAGRPAQAGVLAGQGALEVHTPAPNDFAGFDIELVKSASAKLMDGANDGPSAFDAALAAIEDKQGVAEPQTVRRMLLIASQIYAEAVTAEGVDPIEYQHSYGAALSAADAFRRAEPSLKRENAARAAEAKAELDRFLALYPSLTPPEKPAPRSQLAAQASRVELALSAF